MDDHWRFTAVSITKYDPIFRDEKGNYTKNEWLGFFQVGEDLEDGVLTLDKYLETESKYVAAAEMFFEFHGCNTAVLKTVERYDFSGYNYIDRKELIVMYDSIANGGIISKSDIGTVVKLVLRELIWAELTCTNSEQIALHFGYDFYMYFNSDKDMNDLFSKVKELGLFVD